jgi:enamine deaminase RidA (YjgF/YER057c/UK114 family)
MGNEYIQPPELFESQRFGYTQVVKAGPGRQLFIAGQGAFDEGFQLVGGDDVAAQTEQALRNLAHALRAGGAGVGDLTGLRIYVTDYTPECAMAIGGALTGFFGDHPPPAQTLVGVAALGMPGMRVEIEASAVVPS